MRKFMKSKKGFSLVELLIVVVIMGILAAIAIPKFINLKDDAQTKTCRSQMSALDSAVLAHCFQNNINSDATGVLVAADGTTQLTPTELAAILAATTSDQKSFPTAADVPTCPSGGTYSLGGTGNVTCTTHGTAKGGT